MKLIALDDGHGMETSGKRTPVFPDTGVFMHENEFNNAVVQLLKINLERCGFGTLLVAPGDIDVPLKTRTDTANRLNADLFVSVHANATTGVWNETGGIVTFHYPGSEKGRNAAIIIHRHLMQGTQFRDLGVKEENFHVLRETKMPAVLVECGFMDNLREAKLLLTGAYRQECVDEIAQGICEYFGVTWVPETTDEDRLDLLITDLEGLIKKYKKGE